MAGSAFKWQRDGQMYGGMVHEVGRISLLIYVNLKCIIAHTFLESICHSLFSVTLAIVLDCLVKY